MNRSANIAQVTFVQFHCSRSFSKQAWLMHGNSSVCSHSWSFIIIPATYLLCVHWVFPRLSAVSKQYFSSISNTSEVNHLEFENSYHLMYNCVKKIQMYNLDAENQHSHIKKLCEESYQWVLSAHRISAPRRPHSVF